MFIIQEMGVEKLIKEILDKLQKTGGDALRNMEESKDGDGEEV